MPDRLVNRRTVTIRTCCTSPSYVSRYSCVVQAGARIVYAVQSEGSQRANRVRDVTLGEKNNGISHRIVCGRGLGGRTGVG